eukprot:gene14922-biopygen1960
MCCVTREGAAPVSRPRPGLGVRVWLQACLGESGSRSKTIPHSRQFAHIQHVTGIRKDTWQPAQNLHGNSSRDVSGPSLPISRCNVAQREKPAARPRLAQPRKSGARKRHPDTDAERFATQGC